MLMPVPGMVIMGPNGLTLKLEEALGAGAFGVVFKAIDSTDSKCFAVKFPQFALFGGTVELTAFNNEVQASKTIQSDKVVKVLYVNIDYPDFPPYIVMEYLTEGTLKKKLDEFRSTKAFPSIELIRSWTNDLIGGITAINEKMLHRDLKPDNILLDGINLKIADFGLSKIIGAATRSRTFKGAQHVLYMAPEAWNYERNDIQIDMYSMGIVLYELASLEYPYDIPAHSYDFNAIKDMHLYSNPKPLQKIRTDLSLYYSQTISKLLEKNPNDRFKNWSEVGLAIEKAWNDSGTGGKNSKLITSMLEEVENVYQANAAKDNEQKKLRTIQHEERHLDDFQKVKLLDLLSLAIEEFNSESMRGKITTRPPQISNNINRIEYDLPLGGSVRIHFFNIDPPLRIKKGISRYAAQVVGELGIGFNILLCRSGNEDLYGKWILCKVKVSPWVGRREYSRDYEPFGFDVDEIREIETADQAMHIYQIEFGENLKEEFLELLLESIKLGKGRHLPNTPIE